MDAGELSKAIEDYRVSKIDRAILLSGEWGSGKTYYVKEKLAKKKKYIYVSAFGLKDVSELDLSILTGAPWNSFKPERKKAINKAQQVLIKIPTFAKDILKQVSFKGFKIPDSLFDATTILNVNSGWIKKTLIIIDDIERSTIPLDVLLGKISIYTEQYGFKLLLVANTAKFNKDDNELFLKYKEKIIREEIVFRQDYEAVIKGFIGSGVNKDVRPFLKRNEDSIINFINDFNIKNLRQIQYGINKASEVIRILKKYSIYKDEKEYGELISDIILFSIYDCAHSGDYGAESYSEIQTIRIESAINGPKNLRYFDFIATNGIFEIKCKSSYIARILDGHLKTLIESRQVTCDPVMILYENGYLMEDDELSKLAGSILDRLRDGEYTYKYYPRIILVLIRYKNIMGEGSFLREAKAYMLDNIDSIDDDEYDFIDLATFSFYSSKEADEYKEEISRLRESIRSRKGKQAFVTVNNALNDACWSIKLKEAVTDNKDAIVSGEQFFSLLRYETIIEKLKREDVKTVDYYNLRDAISIIYHRLSSQPSIFYKSDYEPLKDFRDRINTISAKGRTSSLALKYLKNDIDSYLSAFEMVRKIS